MRLQSFNKIACLIGLLILSYCSWAKVIASSDSTVILLGIDGLRPNAIDAVPAHNLQQLATTGIRAKGMIPVMPTKTFVNFYSMATGLYPKHHGMISNSPYDRRLAKTFNAGLDVQNPEWWAGEPIWISAEKQGIKTATYFGG